MAFFFSWVVVVDLLVAGCRAGAGPGLRCASIPPADNL